MTTDALIWRSAPLRDQVYDAIEEMIITHAIPPGGRLVEGDLAARLSVSRNPVREALTALKRAGWIEVRRHQGAVIRDQSIEDAEDCFRVRLVLEPEAARAAAAAVRAGTGGIAAAAQDLRGLVESPSAGSDGDADDADLVRLNAEFHARFAALSGNRLLTQLTSALDKQMQWYLRAVDLNPTSTSWQEHGELLNAVLQGDEQAAHARTVVHIERTLTVFRERWHAAHPEP